MYKHNASSIKESNDKQFVSAEDKQKWNDKAESNHKHPTQYYTKDQVDKMVDTSMVGVSGETINTLSSEGYVHDLTIKGLSTYVDSVTKIKNVGDPIGDGRYKINLVSRTLNLFNFDEYVNSIRHINGVFINYTDKSIIFDASVNNNIMSQVTAISPKMLDKDLDPEKQYILQYEFDDIGDLRTSIGFHYASGDQYYETRGGKTSGTIYAISNPSKSVTDVEISWNTQMNKGKTTLKNILIHELVPEKIPYHDYQKQVNEIILPCQLGSINDSRDVLRKREDGLWIIEKQVKTIELNSSVFKNADNHSYRAQHILPDAKPKSKWNVKSGFRMFIKSMNRDTYIEEKATFDEIKYQDSAHYFFIETDGRSVSITNALYNTFKDKENIVFEIEYLAYIDPIVLPENFQIMLNTFDTRTIITTEQENGMQPYITGNIPTSIVKSLSSTYEMVENNRKRIELLNNLKDIQELDYHMNKNLFDIGDTNRGIINDIKISGKTIRNVLYKEPTLNNMSYAGNADDFTYKVSKGYLKWSNPTNIGYPKLKLPDNIIEVGVDYTLFFTFSTTAPNISSVKMAYGCSTDMYPDHTPAKTVDLKSKNGIAAVHVHITSDMVHEGLDNFKIAFSSFAGNYEFKMSMPVMVKGRFTKEDYPGIIKGLSSVDGIEIGTNRPMVIGTRSRNLFDAKTYAEALIRSADTTAGKVSYTGTGIKIYSKVTDGWMHTTMDIDGTHEDKYKKFAIKVKPNTKYTISYIVKSVYGSVNTDLFIGYKTNNLTHSSYRSMLLNNTITNTLLTSSFITPIDCEYIVVRFDNNTAETTVEFSDIMLNEGDYIPYEPFKSSTKDIKTTDGASVSALRSLPNGVKDTIEKINGKYYLIKRCGHLVLKGSHYGHHKSTDPEEFKTCLAYGIVIPNSIVESSEENGKCICSTMTYPKYTNIWTEDVPGIYINHNNHLITRIPKSYLTTVNITGFKKWVDDNPFEIVYELLTPEYYELENIEPESFEGYTSLYLTSTVKTEVEFKIPTHINNTIFSLQDKIAMLEERVQKLSVAQLSKALKVIDQTNKVDSLVEITNSK